MRSVSPEFAINVAQGLTQLCRLWTIMRKDGAVYLFTDHDRDIIYNGDVYLSTTAFQATAVQSSINSAAADLDVNVLLASGSIEYDDMARGLFDDAPVSLEVIQYTDTPAGTMALFRGKLSTISLPNRQVGDLALIGGVAVVDRYFTERYSPQCRAMFGDARCKVSLGPMTAAFSVTSVTKPQEFYATALVPAAVALYTLGVVEWTSGKNNGTKVQVAFNQAGTVQLLFRPPYQINPGDAGTIVRGCPKTVAACTAYGNLANYRGEPYVPGDNGLG